MSESDDNYVEDQRAIARRAAERLEDEALRAAFLGFIDAWVTHRHAGTAGIVLSMGVGAPDFMTLLEIAENVAAARPARTTETFRADMAVVLLGVGYQYGIEKALGG